jgi:hypothetical protein
MHDGGSVMDFGILGNWTMEREGCRCVSLIAQRLLDERRIDVAFKRIKFLAEDR